MKSLTASLAALCFLLPFSSCVDDTAASETEVAGARDAAKQVAEEERLAAEEKRLAAVKARGLLATKRVAHRLLVADRRGIEIRWCEWESYGPTRELLGEGSDTPNQAKFEVAWCSDGSSAPPWSSGLIMVFLDIKNDRWRGWSGLIELADPRGWKGLQDTHDFSWHSFSGALGAGTTTIDDHWKNLESSEFDTFISRRSLAFVLRDAIELDLEYVGRNQLEQMLPAGIRTPKSMPSWASDNRLSRPLKEAWLSNLNFTRSM